MIWRSTATVAVWRMQFLIAEMPLMRDTWNYLGIKLIAGRAFTDNREAESKGNLILNRASAKKFGIAPDSIVGEKLHFDWQGQHYCFQVIGVMEDYNQTSLKDPILPLMFDIADTTNRYNFHYCEC